MTAEEKYQEELEEHNRYYGRRKPKRESFFTHAAFIKAQERWRLDKAIDAPNKPGYVVANND